MSNSVFSIVTEGELQFYKAINEYKIEKFGEPEYDENAMKIFESKIKHSLKTLETLKPKKPSEFSEKELEKILNDRKNILSKNNFPKKYLPYFSMTAVKKTQTSLVLAELEYYQHFLNNGASGYGFSPELEKTEYGKLIKGGFDNKDCFISAIGKIRDAQVTDKTTYIQQLAKGGGIRHTEVNNNIKKHTGLFNIIFEMKKQFVEPPKSKAEETIGYYLEKNDIFGLVLYLEENVFPRY